MLSDSVTQYSIVGQWDCSELWTDWTELFVLLDLVCWVYHALGGRFDTVERAKIRLQFLRAGHARTEDGVHRHRNGTNILQLY